MASDSTNSQGTVEFLQYLQASRYRNTYQFLVLAQEQLKARKYLLDEALKTIRHNIENLNNKKEELRERIKEVHALQFDLIAKSFMLIEDLMYFYKFLRDDPEKLSEIMITTRGFDRNKVLEEWKHLSVDEVVSIYKFQLPNNLRISLQQKKIVEEILGRQVNLIQKKFATVSRFWTDYVDVYNGFKHGLTAIPGSVILGKEPFSIILVRRKKQQRACTYHIPVSLATIAYYEQITSDALSLLKLLIESFALFIQNREGFFIPTLWKDELKLTPNESEVLNIANTMFEGFFKNYVLEINIHPPRVEEMKKAFAERHIYCNPNFDIYSMKPRISIS